MLNLQETNIQARVLRVLVYPDPRLNEIAEEVIEFGTDLDQLIVDMYRTMVSCNGVGIAAPQVGVNKRVIVLKLQVGNGEDAIVIPVVMINPVILARSGTQTFEEGCLSVPGYFADVERANHIIVGYQTNEGVHASMNASGFPSVAIQHEIDHLDGKVFIETLSPFKQARAKAKIEKTMKEYQRNNHPAY